jgi:DNA-binding transcriptional regulator LsrR (DeoR family)
VRRKSSDVAKTPDRRPKAVARRIPDEEAIAIAVARYSSHPPKPLLALARETGRAPAVISRTIGRALREGLVEVVPAQRVSTPVRKAQLERRVLQKYTGLRGCLVVEAKEVTSAIDNDALHRRLGFALASVLGSGSTIRDGDVLGLGSGRGVYWTIQSLASQPPLRAEVTLCSLTGQVYARDHSEQVNLLLDADIHLGLLGLCFSRPVTLCPMSHPIVVADPHEAATILEQSRLGESWWKLNPVTHAIVGVGVLANGHRFFNEVKLAEPRQTQLLDPIKRPLTALVAICEETLTASNGFYCPVADIANRLFYVPPPGRLRMAERARKTLEAAVQDHLAEINSRLVTVGEAQLRSISQIVVVAGSRLKSSALRTLLRSGFPVRLVCIDQQLAEELLLDEEM